MRSINSSRRSVITRVQLGFAIAASSTLGLAPFATGQSAAKLRVIASKFKFTPNVIHVKRGQSTTLVLTSVDILHGFGIPELGLRKDLIPGKEVELSFTPSKVGRFHIICDNFCGEGHDDMSGWLIVE
jgi:cytochrome c oxidase subunit II